MKRLISALFVISAAANMAVAADKPDFSGHWKLDVEKSTFGPIPAPASMVRTVEKKGSDLSVEQTLTGPDLYLSFQYSLDGKETANNLMGTDFKSKTNWEGAALIIHNTVEAGGGSTNKWTLSADGKTFTDVLSVTSPEGNFEITYVLVRQ
jgi:hypothetical protein